MNHFDWKGIVKGKRALKTENILIQSVFLMAWFTLVSCDETSFVDLSGQWMYRLDTVEVGEQEKWFTQHFEENGLFLPAALRDQNIGHTPSVETQWTGGIYDSSWYFLPEMAKYRNAVPSKFPFWLTPVKRYVGKAWYQKEINIPADWKGEQLELFLERPHWQTQVWFDDQEIGSENSLSTPHVFILASALVTSGQHRITICVDNAIRGIDPGINSHSISDHTQGNWNGIVGKMELRRVESISIAQVRIMPNLQKQRVSVEISLSGNNATGEVDVTLAAVGVNHSHEVKANTKTCNLKDGKILAHLDMGEDFNTWSEFAPNLYELSIALKDSNGNSLQQTQTFGMREFTIDQKQFEINGTPVFLRGTTDCSVFPLTGYPPTDVPSWEKIFKKCRSFGLNHVRFHSYCPPEAAFVAADKIGIYLQVEGPSWAKYSVTLGDGLPIDQYLMDETRHIIDTYGNHPSFVMMAYGNEPSGNYVPYLENWVDYFREYDPQRVFTGASTGRSWSIIDNSDFIVRSPPRGLEWDKRKPESDFDYRDKTENQNRPYVTFEMGQWCAFPNFEEIDKYTGSLKALNFELFQENLHDHHMGDQAHDFLMASGKLQASCYKQEIEATLRTPNLAGFQLLSLNDFSGQGTALVGVLDAFWEEKGYISADEFRQFCQEVVPLVRLPRYTFSSQEQLKAEIEVANFGAAVMKDASIGWRLSTTDSTVVNKGELDSRDIPIGLVAVGGISVPLESIKKAQKLILEVQIGNYRNQWSIWVYPPIQNPAETKDIFITDTLGEKAVNMLKDGGKVLLQAAGKVENGKNVKQHYMPAFWNTSWFRMRPPHTTGVLIDEAHPVFDQFPTDYYSDLQWWELVNQQQVMNLEYFPPAFRPIVQPIDTWFLNRRLAMLFEAKVGEGRLMVCSIDWDKENSGVVSQQFRQSLLSYMNSTAFQPENQMELSVIQELFEEKEREEWHSFVNDNP
ncbi:sugar-binding domain-containing protein [Reichenbachiella ulvae]|uniref:beta-galactosidase n=1 Tax=Reichenbachiella ulvae TaxID=2980104 RepID=A0ABT3CUR3_9BACT|nr:sugar-binding domain-containing protein [Reichenbachiella ulvae]MCV9387337.1 beta-glucuronidase [Reichenbachiella ulvae]